MSTNDNVTENKLNYVTEKIKKLTGHNYAKQKTGWITFNDNRPKIKLRKYVTKLAQSISNFDGSNFRENRQVLIDYYNKDGVVGIGRAFTVAMTSKIAKIKVKD